MFYVQKRVVESANVGEHHEHGVPFFLYLGRVNGMMHFFWKE